MASFKDGVSSKGRTLHYTVGAVIKKDGKFLLIDRANKPFGFACVAGHVDEDESEEEALKREVKEECGMDIKNFKMVGEEELIDNLCNKKAKDHYWYVYECEVFGKLKKNGEAKKIEWYGKEEIKNLELEDSWKRWFKKLGII